MIQNVLKTCVLDVRMDVPISRLDAAAAVAGAPAIYHLQALSQHFLPKRTRNKLSKGKKYLFHFTIRG